MLSYTFSIQTECSDFLIVNMASGPLQTVPYVNTPSLVSNTTHSQTLQSYLFIFLPTVLNDKSMPKLVKKKRKNIVKSAADVYWYLPQDMPNDLGELNVSIIQ